MPGSTAPWFFEQFRAANGSALAGGRMYFWVAGSTTVPKAVYADYTLTTPLVQPLILDGSGNAPEYFMESGLYKIVIRDSSLISSEGMLGGLVATRDNVSGAGGGGDPGVDDHLVITNPSDPTPGSLIEKTQPSSSVAITVVDSGGRKLQFTVDEGWLANWLTINYPFPADEKVRSNGTTGDVAGYIVQKITDKNGATFDVDANKKVVVPLQDYVPLAGGVTIANPISFPDQFKIKAGAGDIAGYYVDKIQPGTGIEFNQTVDGVNGVVLHISKTDDGALTAPLHEVITGDGAGGVLSDPGFTAVGGDVSTETITASDTGPAITAPNGSVLASGVAEMAQSAWAGTGAAWFGPEGQNPATDDGTLCGLIATEFAAIVRGPHGGSATLGTGLGNLAVYDDQAAADVPTSAPAFHQLDAVILTGASYTSTYHATICFFGTGTAFVVPAGNSLNRTIRLSNSSAASISVTGVATAFTLAPGQSRDLFWSSEVTPKWY